MRFSNKQTELLRAFKNNELKRINILHGSVRSGKTWISLVLWAFWILTMPKSGSYLMVAKTLTSLKRNCLDLLQTLTGERNFTYSLPSKQATLFGRTIYLEGVNDIRSESKIRGMTLNGAYCDEITLFTSDFFTMLLSRLSEPNAKLFGTTNPANPMHWFKVDYLNRQDILDMLVLHFYIDDNPYLDPEYIKQLKLEYTGVFYERYILGKWVVAEGAIYPHFDAKIHTFKSQDAPKSGLYYISCDYGTINPFSIGLWRISNGKAYRVKEYYYDSRAPENFGRQKTDEEYYKQLEQLAGNLNIQYVIVDPSAASFIQCIRRHAQYNVILALNSVVDGIRYTSSFLQAGRLLIHESCINSIKEFGLYRWDEKSTVDKPIKENDHAMDDIRYFCSTILLRELGMFLPNDVIHKGAAT